MEVRAEFFKRVVSGLDEPSEEPHATTSSVDTNKSNADRFFIKTPFFLDHLTVGKPQTEYKSESHNRYVFPLIDNPGKTDSGRILIRMARFDSCRGCQYELVTVVVLAIHECVNGYADCRCNSHIEHVIVNLNLIGVFDLHIGAVHMSNLLST